MKTTISDFVIAFFDLLEAEGREFKNNTKKVIFNSLTSVLGVFIVGFMFLIAVFSFACGLYMWLKTLFSAYVSAFLLSILFFVFGVILFLFIKQRNDRT